MRSVTLLPTGRLALAAPPSFAFQRHGGERNPCAPYNRCRDVDSAPCSHSEPQPRAAVEQLLRRGRPLPSYEEMVIDDLMPEEAEAFLAAVLS